MKYLLLKSAFTEIQRQASGPPTDTKENRQDKEKICGIFRQRGQNITIEANKKVVNFLDVTLDLNTEKFKPYSKPLNIPLFVHSKSNHRPNLIRNIRKPCLMKLQLHIRTCCARVGIRINWSLIHPKRHHPKDVIDRANISGSNCCTKKCQEQKRKISAPY